MQANQAPSHVLAERLPDGPVMVRLTDNVTEGVDSEGYPVYTYDEVAFVLDADRSETAADIEDAFEDWWDYGKLPDEPPATLEERVSDLEAVVLALLEV